MFWNFKKWFWKFKQIGNHFDIPLFYELWASIYVNIMWHHLKCAWYCVNENWHILLQSFHGFVKRIVLFLHAIRYSLTEIKVWFMRRFFATINWNYFGQFFITSICQHLFHLLPCDNLRVILIRDVVTVDWWFLTGLNKLRARWRVCTQRVRKEFFAHQIRCT